MRAAREGDVDRLQALIETGEDIDHTDELLTALMLAAREGHVDALTLLLEAGADISYQDKDGMTALMRATISGHVECVSELIKAGADTAVNQAKPAATHPAGPPPRRGRPPTPTTRDRRLITTAGPLTTFSTASLATTSSQISHHNKCKPK